MHPRGCGRFWPGQRGVVEKEPTEWARGSPSSAMAKGIKRGQIAGHAGIPFSCVCAEGMYAWWCVVCVIGCAFFDSAFRREQIARFMSSASHHSLAPPTSPPQTCSIARHGLKQTPLTHPHTATGRQAMLCRSGSRRATSWTCAASSNTTTSLRRLSVLRPLSSIPTSPTTIPLDDRRASLNSSSTSGKFGGQRRSLSSSSSTPKPTSPHGSTISLESQRRILQRCDELQSYLQVQWGKGKRRGVF